MDNVNPDHYAKSCSLECIEAMELYFGKDALYDFCICNAWKYIWRWKNKNGVEDLHKADWYLSRAMREYRGTLIYDGGLVNRLRDYIREQIQKQEVLDEKLGKE